MIKTTCVVYDVSKIRLFAEINSEDNGKLEVRRLVLLSGFVFQYLFRFRLKPIKALERWY